MTIPDKYYSILKHIAQVILPALGTLYFALATIWGFPYGEQIVGTITAIDAFMGACLHISTQNYKGDGVLNVDTSDPKTDKYSLDFTTDLNEVGEKDSVLLRVKKKSQSEI